MTVIPMITAATVRALRLRRFASGGAGGANFAVVFGDAPLVADGSDAKRSST